MKSAVSKISSFAAPVFGAICCFGFMASTRAAEKPIEMKPLILVAADQKTPTAQQTAIWVKHLQWTQRYFAERLNGDSFRLASGKVTTVRLRRPLSFYQGLTKGEAATYWTAELLDHFDLDRFECPYTFCCLVMNPKERWPIGGGRCINGGINRGGGLLVMSSFAMDRLPNFQSTLRHEIAHTVGLPHVDVYGYDMKTTRSLMAYNTMHQTNGFRESRTPARLIPEDVRALALADRVFPGTRFDTKADVPSGYKLFPRVISLGAMTIPGRPDYGPKFTTPSGEGSGSSIANLNQRFIPASQGPGVTFDKRNMWASEKQPDGRIVVDIEFPMDVTLTAFIIHSEHSGQYNPATNVIVETVKEATSFQVADLPLNQTDARVQFAAASSRRWRLILQAGKSGKVCLRGLQFLNGQSAVFPPPVPYQWQQAAAK